MAVLQLMMGRPSAGGVVNHTVSIAFTLGSNPSTSPTPANEIYTATPINGVGPFTYLWTRLSGAGVTLTNTTTASCTITTNTGSPQSRAGDIRCTVTDTGNGGYSAFADVPYVLEVL